MPSTGANALAAAAASRNPTPPPIRAARMARRYVKATSAAGRALRLDVDRVDRLARGHEQAIPLAAAEAEVGASLGQQDPADQRAVRRKHRDAIMALAAREAGPDIALGVAADAVGEARLGVEEEPPVHRLAVDDVVHARGLWAVRRVDHVEALLVGREAETVGPFHVADGDSVLAGRRVETIDAVGHLLRRLVAEIVAA